MLAVKGGIADPDSGLERAPGWQIVDGDLDDQQTVVYEPVGHAADDTTVLVQLAGREGLYMRRIRRCDSGLVLHPVSRFRLPLRVRVDEAKIVGRVVSVVRQVRRRAPTALRYPVEAACG